MTATTAATPTRLADRDEIVELVSRLGAALDEGRFDDMERLLVEESTARTPGGIATGRAAVIAQARRNHRADLRVQHVITNPIVELQGDVARIRANLVVHFAPAAEATVARPVPTVGYILGEVYRFDVVRRADGWRFASIDATPVWMSGTRPV